MAQTSSVTFSPAFISAKNLNVAITASASSVIDALNVSGFYQFGLTVSNYAASGSAVGNVDVWASEDNVTYFQVTSNVMSGTIAVNAMQHYEFKILVNYLRIKITSAGTSTIDVTLNGIPT